MVSSYKNKIIWLIILSAVLPPGIGIPLMGSSIDIGRILFFISLIMVTIISIQTKSISIPGIYFFLIIFFCFVSSLFWMTAIQYTFFVYYVFLFSIFFVTKYLFVDEKLFLLFVNRISLLVLISGIVSILNYYFDFIPFEYLRANNEAYVLKNRGELAGITFQAYMGFDGSAHWFTLKRFFWLTLSIFTYIEYWDKANNRILNKKVLFYSIILGAIEILMSQTRFILVLLLPLMLLFLIKNRMYRKYYVLLILLIYFIDFQTINYYISNFTSLFFALGFDVGDGFKYIFDQDKRVMALQSIINSLDNYKIYLGHGPLYWNFSDFFLGEKVDYFDDITPIVSFFIEFGIISWLLLFGFIFWGWSSAVTPSGKIWKYSSILLMMASIPNFSPMFYYFLFFSLGAMFSTSSKISISNY